MHPLAARTVRLVLAAGGNLDPIESYADLAALDESARATQSLPLWRVCDLLDRPLIVGDLESRHGQPAILWRPSYAALHWIGDTAAACGRWENLCVAWALAFARSPRLLREDGADPRRATRAAHAWAADLNCSMEALLHATVGLLHESRPETPRREKPDQPPPRAAERLVLARLQKEFGQDEDYWLFGPAARTDAALDLMRRMDDAESLAISKSSGKTQARDPDSPEVLAFARWRDVRDAFEKKYRPTVAP